MKEDQIDLGAPIKSFSQEIQISENVDQDERMRRIPDIIKASLACADECNDQHSREQELDANTNQETFQPTVSGLIKNEIPKLDFA